MVELFTVYRKLTRVGTGNAIFIPPEFLRQIGASVNDYLELTLTDNEQIIIKKRGD